MSIKSLGLSLWGATTSRSSTTIIQKRGSQSGESTPTGFGLPSPQDPDPFGVRALELAGLEIKEAGSCARPSFDAFEYRPSPTSPVFRLSTQSGDITGVSDSRRNSRRNSKRNSKRSLLSVATDGASSEPKNGITSPPPLPPRPASLSSMTSTTKSSSPVTATFAIDAGIVQSPTATETKLSRSQSLRSNPQQVPETIDEIIDEEESDEDDDEEEFFDEEDIIIEEVSTSMVPVVPTVLATPLSAKVKVVSIKKKGPPALPLKSPLRAQQFLGTSMHDDSHEDQDESSTDYSLSPDKNAFDKGEPSPNPWSEQTSLQDNESIRCKDTGRGSLSLSDRDDTSMKSPSLDTDDFPDTKETTPIATTNDFLLPSTAYNPVEEQVKHDMTTDLSLSGVTEPADTVVNHIENEGNSSSDNKSIISGSTAASISDVKEIDKSHSEQNLASLIKQGLSEGITDENDDEHSTLDYYYHQDNDTSDYEDDIPGSIPSEKPIASVSIDHKLELSY